MLRQRPLPPPAYVPERSPPSFLRESRRRREAREAWKAYGGRVVAISRPSPRRSTNIDDSVCWWRYELADDKAPPLLSLLDGQRR